MPPRSSMAVWAVAGSSGCGIVARMCRAGEFGSMLCACDSATLYETGGGNAIEKTMGITCHAMTQKSEISTSSSSKN